MLPFPSCILWSMYWCKSQQSSLFIMTYINRREYSPPELETDISLCTMTQEGWSLKEMILPLSVIQQSGHKEAEIPIIMQKQNIFTQINLTILNCHYNNYEIEYHGSLKILKNHAF